MLKAGTAFRWTGSWLTVFTTADPEAGQSSGANATLAEQEQLIDLLNRRRLAGYESYAPPPTLVSIDLQITVCVKDGWLSSDVEAGVLARLADAKLPDGTAGFFYADSFTFGTPLYRSNLEAAIQGVHGVNGVLDVEYRQRGASNMFTPLPDVLQFGTESDSAPRERSRLSGARHHPSFPRRVDDEHNTGLRVQCGQPAHDQSAGTRRDCVSRRRFQHASAGRCSLLCLRLRASLRSSSRSPHGRPMAPTPTVADLGVMMVEWWAYLGDILTFYNERIANEDYLAHRAIAGDPRGA